MRRGIAATALVATLALAATACGGDTKDNGGDTQSGGELSGTVTWWDTSNDAEKASFQKIAEAFTAKHPKVTVKYVNVPYGDAQNKVKNAFSSGSEAPDVIRADVGWVADFASLGYLDEVPADTVKKVDAEFLPQAAASGKYEGKTYAVPQVIDTLGLFYNKKMLADAACRAPQDAGGGQDRRRRHQGEDRQGRPLPARRRLLLVPAADLRRGRRPGRREDQDGHRRQPGGRQGLQDGA